MVAVDELILSMAIFCPAIDALDIPKGLLLLSVCKFSSATTVTVITSPDVAKVDVALLDATVIEFVPGAVLSKVILLPDKIAVACVPWFPARSVKSMVNATVPLASSESMVFVAVNVS